MAFAMGELPQCLKRGLAGFYDDAAGLDAEIPCKVARKSWDAQSDGELNDTEDHFKRSVSDCSTADTSDGDSGDIPTKDQPVGFKEHLEDVELIGCGRFAQVRLVRCKVTSQVFALKVLSKSAILQKKAVDNVVAEKMILKSTCSPFIIRLHATFNSEKHLDFLLEAALGGDLFTVYERNENLVGSASHARFYTACVLRGLEHLHERNIIYRDLKMENVMVHASGYAKLTDFGLSKLVSGHTYTKCGTPDYMAPEIIRGDGYTVAVDWWALGVFVFALMEGSLPFDSSNSCLIFWKVQCGIDSVNFSDADSTWADLVRSLCKQEPGERLPVRAGANGVKEHAFFQEVNFGWSALNHGEAVAPYVPKLSGPLDIKHFEACEADVPNRALYEDLRDGYVEGKFDMMMMIAEREVRHLYNCAEER